MTDKGERGVEGNTVGALTKFPDENPNPVLRIGSDGTVIYGNRASEPLLEDWHSAVGDRLEGDWLKIVRQAATSGCSQQLETQCAHRFFTLTFSPVPGADYVNLYGLDITDRKESEVAVRVSEERFRGIFEQSHDAIFIIDPEEDRIIDANPRACELSGYDLAGLRATVVSALYPDEASRRAAFDRAKERPAPNQTSELTCVTKTGASVPVELSASPVRFQGSSFLLLIVRDITERKQAETALRSALEEVERLKNRLQAENVYLRDEINVEHDFAGMIGRSPEFQAVLRKVEQVASTRSTVLIQGESGTGKELVARAIHNASARRDRPLVKVNCAALSATLIESELFGHEKGSFTGALTRRSGRFELADGGTIFLDEIGEVPLELQAKLLRVLQEGEFERIGGTKSLGVDARVIAATNRQLEKAVAAGAFREDLFYRLNVFPIVMPALRERRQDIALLAAHFIRKHGARMGRTVEAIPEDGLNRLLEYDWPGNIRELENVIERALILSRGRVLQLDEPFQMAHTPTQPVIRKHRTLREVEISLIREALEDCHGVIEGKRGVAQRLGIPPSTLRERMKRYGLQRPPRQE